MAYIFPINPYDGELYPVPAIPGALQYQWNAALNVWLIFSPLGVQSVSGQLPIVVNNGTSDAVVSILPATINTAGSMSPADKAKLDAIPADAKSGTVTSITAGNGLLGGTITTSGTIALQPATNTSLGGVTVGNNIDVTGGVISIPTARFGVTSINVGPGLIGSPTPITSVGTIQAALATRLTVGAIRVGNGLNVTLDGTLSLGGSLGDVGVLAWGTVNVSSTVPYVFNLTEGYNISSIAWLGADPGPRVRVYFQRPLTNANYGVFATGFIRPATAPNVYTQSSVTINPSLKTITYVDLACLSVITPDYRTNGSGTNEWNKWNELGEFDIMIVDTAVY